MIYVIKEKEKKQRELCAHVIGKFSTKWDLSYRYRKIKTQGRKGGAFRLDEWNEQGIRVRTCMF